jgi:uncharacterized membrane protein
MIDALIRALDGVVKGLELAINAIYRAFDFIIETIDRVSRRIASLLLSGARLVFYVFPFGSMVAIGARERLTWLFWLGVTFFGLCMVLFIRELLAAIKGVSVSAGDLTKTQRDRVFISILIINLLALIYFCFSFQRELMSFLRSFAAYTRT